MEISWLWHCKSRSISLALAADSGRHWFVGVLAARVTGKLYICTSFTVWYCSRKQVLVPLKRSHCRTLINSNWIPNHFGWPFHKHFEIDLYGFWYDIGLQAWDSAFIIRIKSPSNRNISQSIANEMNESNDSIKTWRENIIELDKSGSQTRLRWKQVFFGGFIAAALVSIDVSNDASRALKGRAVNESSCNHQSIISDSFR